MATRQRLTPIVSIRVLAPRFCIATVPFVLFLLGACGSQAPSQIPEIKSAGTARPIEKPEPSPPKGALWRKDVERVVQAGLGRFLQKVSVEAKLEDGAFVGFEVVDLTPPDFWEGVDLKRGDVVTSLNGLPIERETQAFAAFESLKTANELVVSYRRGNESREIRYRILESPGAGAPGSAGAAAKSSPAEPAAPEATKAAEPAEGASLPAGLAPHEASAPKQK